MTVTIKNVDPSLFEVLKSLVNMCKDVSMQQTDENENVIPSSEQHIQQINDVYSKIPAE